MSETAVQTRKEALVDRLRPDQYELWDALVDRSPHGTVFHKAWWLAATGSQFEILGCWNEQGELSAGIPLFRKRKNGLTLCHSPSLTPYLGPVFDLSGATRTRDKIYLMRSQGELLARSIQGFDTFCQIAGTDAPDLQGFLWAGFHVELGYTFRFDPRTTVGDALQEAARTHRQKLNPRRNGWITMERGSDIAALMELNRRTFSRKGRPVPYSESMVRALAQSAVERGCGVIYVARGREQQPLSAVFVVHDSRASYQIVSGIEWSDHNPDAGYVTTWAAIQDALEAGRAFDFEGSRIRGVEQYYRRWGAPAKPTWKLKKAGSLRGRLATILFNSVNGTN